MCVIALKSMTYAIKAKKALSDFYIDSEIVRLEPNMTKKGCAYGISFNCVNLDSAKEAFKKWSIRYTELIRN
ncbi:MAG: DUF3343 domain-containing protein [Ruminococcaceae bacterium]|nr:DUF3343 domain-containing protein [Oscillospiraceae bacterium]